MSIIWKPGMSAFVSDGRPKPTLTDRPRRILVVGSSGYPTVWAVPPNRLAGVWRIWSVYEDGEEAQRMTWDKAQPDMDDEATRLLVTI